jgi:predicted phage terminase large subunit-like protein
MGAAEELDLEELGLDIVPDRIELDREIASRGLLPFLRVAWERVEKDPLVLGWHNELVCETLEAVSRGYIRDLVINIPPGMTKSLTGAVAWPVWEWIEIDGALRFIFATYSDALSKRDALRTKNLVDSPWFQARWPRVRFPQSSSRSMQRLENAEGGVRFSTSIKGGVTGRHAHRIVVDDPIKPLDTIGSRAALGTELDLVGEWWDQTMSTRQADPKRTAKVVIMQRLHSRDLAQKVLDEVDGVVHLNLPMRYEAKAHCEVRWTRREVDDEGTPVSVEIVREDPREDEGELLCEARYPEVEVRKLEKALGTRGTAAQLQQRPTPEGGLTFEKPWFRYWGVRGPFAELPFRARQVQIWDMTFKGKPSKGKKRSFVCGQVWAVAGADMFLLGMERGQWGLVQQQKALLRLTGAFPKAHRKYIEDAANGPAIVDSMKSKVSGMKLVPTGGGSEARAEAASIHFESGNVWFPDPSIAPWVEEVEDELLAFPMGRYDDIVDCVSHAVVLLAEKTSASYSKAMKNVRGGGIVS